MFYENWMSFIKDDAKITKIAIPGSHNSATIGMIKLAKCQSGSLYEQYKHGVRFFDIRLKSDKKGRLFVAHGISKGMPAEEAFRNLQHILSESNEFFILGIRTYMNQQIGPVKLSYNGNTEETNRLIKKYLSPEKYALTEFDNIGDVTMGDIRKSGKKYIIINAKKEYEYSCDCPMPDPWDSKIYGYKPEKFAKEILNYLRDIDTDGFFWFQTQQTPNLGTENGWTKWPDDLDIETRKLFPQIISDIANDPVMLQRVNIVAGDFMSQDFMKAKHILSLNLLKNVVKEDKKSEYKKGIR